MFKHTISWMYSNILFTAIQLAEPDENYDPVDLGDSSGDNAPDFTGIDNFFSQPYIFSNSVKSHPLEIFLIILVGGILFGIAGMILAIPTYTVLKVFLKVFFNDNKLIKKLTKNL